MGASDRRRSDSWKTSRSRQRARTCSSRAGKDCAGSTDRKAKALQAISYQLLAIRPLCGEFAADACQAALLVLVERRESAAHAVGMGREDALGQLRPLGRQGD